MTVAKKKTKYQFIGTGALVQLIGLILLFIFPIGTIAGVILLVVGSRMSRRLLCGNCGNGVTKDSKICPHCSARFA